MNDTSEKPQIFMGQFKDSGDGIVLRNNAGKIQFFAGIGSNTTASMEIRDASEKSQIFAGQFSNGGAGLKLGDKLGLYNDENGGRSIVLQDNSSKNRITMGVSSNAVPYLNMFDANDKSQIFMGQLMNGGAGLKFGDKFGLYNEENGERSIVIQDNSERNRFTVGVSSNAAPYLNIFDTNPNARIWMGEYSGGGIGIQVIDTNKQVKLQLPSN